MRNENTNIMWAPDAGTGGGDTGSGSTAKGGGDPGGAAGGGGSGDQPARSVLGAAPSVDKSPRDFLPPELRDEPCLQNYLKEKDLEGAFRQVAKGYKEAQALIGRKGVPLPGDRAGDEEWTAFFNKLPGRAPSAAEIPIAADVQAMAERVMLQEDITAFKETLHKAGLTNAQAQKVMSWAVGTLDTRAKTAVDTLGPSYEEGRAALVKEWGNDTDGNVQLVEALLRQEIGDDQNLVKALQTTRIGNSPTLIRFLHKAAKAMLDDQIRKGFGAAQGGWNAALAGAADKAAIESSEDLRKALLDKTHPNHKTVQEQWFRGIKAASPR